MKIFGFADLESLEIPPHLLNAFCVIGVKENCTQAITYAFKKLKSHERIENLILLEPINLDSLNPQLQAIASYGCKIYSYFTNHQTIDLKCYETFAQFGLVIIVKA
ncbi:hypothetical protein [Helicobacter sp.]|uniref:hypothetical protein n=1 Tax=Helicobacter sp. TaxID=218 RepID=UPI0019CA32EB|nr:hypothetical protein [Helicobacter sp.]MBD5165727.1 hypothetical protein [Helicobacter sp.]